VSAELTAWCRDHDVTRFHELTGGAHD
jgi:hypothetical protein